MWRRLTCKYSTFRRGPYPRIPLFHVKHRQRSDRQSYISPERQRTILVWFIRSPWTGQTPGHLQRVALGAVLSGWWDGTRHPSATDMTGRFARHRPSRREISSAFQYQVPAWPGMAVETGPRSGRRCSAAALRVPMQAKWLPPAPDGSHGKSRPPVTRIR